MMPAKIIKNVIVNKNLMVTIAPLLYPPATGGGRFAATLLLRASPGKLECKPPQYYCDRQAVL